MVVGLAALNLAWLRFILRGRGALLGYGEGEESVLDLGLLAMMDAMAWSWFRHRRRPFGVGFILGGVTAVGIYAGLCWLSPDGFARGLVIRRVVMPVQDWLSRHLLVPYVPGFDPDAAIYPPVAVASLVAAYAVVLTAPLLLVSLAGGLLARYVAAFRKGARG